jgi:hypothetical protein
MRIITKQHNRIDWEQFVLQIDIDTLAAKNGEIKNKIDDFIDNLLKPIEKFQV